MSGTVPARKAVNRGQEQGAHTPWREGRAIRFWSDEHSPVCRRQHGSLSLSHAALVRRWLEINPPSWGLISAGSAPIWAPPRAQGALISSAPPCSRGGGQACRRRGSERGSLVGADPGPRGSPGEVGSPR